MNVYKLFRLATFSSILKVLFHLKEKGHLLINFMIPEISTKLKGGGIDIVKVVTQEKEG